MDINKEFNKWFIKENKGMCRIAKVKKIENLIKWLVKNKGWGLISTYEDQKDAWLECAKIMQKPPLFLIDKNGIASKIKD